MGGGGFWPFFCIQTVGCIARVSDIAFSPTQILGQTGFFLPRRFWDKLFFFFSHADSGTNLFPLPRRFWDKPFLFFFSPPTQILGQTFFPSHADSGTNGVFFPSHADSGTMTKASSVAERRLSRLAGRAGESRSAGFEPRVPSSLLSGVRVAGVSGALQSTDAD